MKFSEMLVEYLDLRDEDQADESDYDFYGTRAGRRDRIQELLKMMDQMVPEPEQIVKSKTGC